MKSVTETLDEN